VRDGESVATSGQRSKAITTDLSSILGESKIWEIRQSWGVCESRPPRFWGGESRRGSQNIIISYNVQEYDENTEHGSKRVL